MSADQASNTDKTVYAKLSNDGTDVWRPVYAIELFGAFKLQYPDNYDPKTEAMEFLPGSVVRCTPRTFSDGTIGLVAVSSVE